MNARKLTVDEQPCNSSYKEDLSFNIRLNALTLRIIGSWPRSLGHSWLQTIQHVLLNLLCYCLLAFILVPGIVYFVLEIDDLYNQMKLGSALSFFMMAVIKYYVFIAREDDIRTCVNLIENDWRNVKHQEDRKIMLDNAGFGHRLVYICGVFMYGGVVFYYIVLPLTGAMIVEEGGNLTYWRLVYPFPKLLLDARLSPANEILYTIQLLSGLVAHNVTVAACGLAALLAMHACGQLQVLTSWLEKLVDGRQNDDESLDQRLANIVEQHVRIIKESSARDIVGRSRRVYFEHVLLGVLHDGGMFAKIANCRSKV
ncbi:hypothetical protein WN48_04722 [Eufriesea mexicana]|nr:hypothetical protein WN48_04722 [Eufriesea mexicana]